MKSDSFTNNIESLFEPTDQEIVLYNHLRYAISNDPIKNLLSIKNICQRIIIGILMTGAIKMDIYFMSIQN